MQILKIVINIKPLLLVFKIFELLIFIKDFLFYFLFSHTQVVLLNANIKKVNKTKKYLKFKKYFIKHVQLKLSFLDF